MLKIKELLINAKKQYYSLRVGVVEFFPTLPKTGLTWQFWCKVAHYKMDRFKDRRYITQIASYLYIECHINLLYN